LSGGLQNEAPGALHDEDDVAIAARHAPPPPLPTIGAPAGDISCRQLAKYHHHPQQLPSSSSSSSGA